MKQINIDEFIVNWYCKQGLTCEQISDYFDIPFQRVEKTINEKIWLLFYQLLLSE